MIYWFSATGNSKHAAEKLAMLLNEEMQELSHQTLVDAHARLIFVIPLYFWGVPYIVKDIFQKIAWNNVAELFVVFTCGGFVGTADRQLATLTRPTKLFVYSLPMESNYIIWHKIGKWHAELDA